jgi:hypothetical protein
MHGRTGTAEGQLKYFDSRAVFHPSGREDLAAEDDRLPLESIRGSLNLLKSDLSGVTGLFGRDAAQYDEKENGRVCST